MIFNARSSSSMIVSYATLVMSSYSSNNNNNNNTVVFLLLLLLLLLLCRPSFVRFSPLYQTKPLSSFDVIFIFSPPHIVKCFFPPSTKVRKNDYVRLVVVLEQRLGVVFGGVTSTTTTHQESQRRKDKSATLVVDDTNTTFPKSSHF